MVRQFDCLKMSRVGEGGGGGGGGGGGRALMHYFSPLTKNPVFNPEYGPKSKNNAYMYNVLYCRHTLNFYNDSS